MGRHPPPKPPQKGPVAATTPSVEDPHPAFTQAVAAVIAENPPASPPPAEVYRVQPEEYVALSAAPPVLRYEGRDLGELFSKVEPGTFPVYDVTPAGWVQMMADARAVTKFYLVPERSLLDAATDGELAIYRPVDRKALRIRWTPAKEKSDG